MTKDKVEELAKELAEKEGKELVDDLLKKSEKAKKDLEAEIEKVVRFFYQVLKTAQEWATLS